MIFYIISVAIYVSAILFIKPSPNSFRDKPLSTKENFLAIKGSLFLGVLFLTIHLFVTDFTFLDVNEDTYQLLALNNSQDNNLWAIQYFTNIFIHFNLIHLLGNVFMIGLLSAYERRVGLKRFLTVFALSGLVSGISILFYSENVAISGISGAVFGIGAVFFTDEKNLTVKEWIYAILTFSVLAIMLSIRDYIDMQKLGTIGFNIDYIAHILGALTAIVYTRIVKLV